MAVPCPGCGREYDVTLFEFGRTLWCTCGCRVGIAPRVRGSGATSEKRFIADAMLGRLARWLRILGFDCAWDAEIDDETLVRRAVHEDRIVLTRDRSLPADWWIAGIHVIGAEDLPGQLRDVVRSFDLAGSLRLFSRCNACNEPLREARKHDVAERVPPRAFAEHDLFLECPACRRVYWQGSHTSRIRRVVDELLNERGAPGGA